MLRTRNHGRVTSFVLDVLAIIVGLTLSFMVDEWRSEQKLRGEEVSIIDGIKLDLQADIDFANDQIIWITRDIAEKYKLLDPTIRRSMEPDSLSRHVGRLHRFNGFMGNDHTYKTIAAEARTLITDPELRRGLQKYYSWTYGFVNDYAEYDKRLSISRLELMRKHIVTHGVKILSPWYSWDDGPEIEFDRESVDRIFSNEEFRSQVHWSMASDELIIRIAKDRIKECERLQGLIDKQLKLL